MSFEPKLVGRDGPEWSGRELLAHEGDERSDLSDLSECDSAPLPDDWQLPAELQQLGDQLRLDAHKLAAQYPPTPISAMMDKHHDAAPRPADNRSAAGRWAATVAGLLASGLVLAALGTAGRVIDWRRSASPIARESTARGARNTVAGVPARESASPSSEASVSPAAAFPASADPAAALPGGGVEAATPVMFLQEVSGPELEGLLDLLEEDPGLSRNIAI